MSKAAAANNRLWMYVSAILLVILVVYIILYPPGKQSGFGSEAVAKVNDVTIGKDKLYEALVAAGGSQTLDTLINNELVRQAADQEGVKLTDADIEKEMEAVRQNFGSEDELLSALAMYGMTLDSLKKDMEVQALLRKLLEPKVSVTDEDVQKYYDENLDSLKTPEQVKVSHILTETKEEAEAILAELKNGADFTAQAKEKSTDTLTKDSGGDLDFIAKGDKEEAVDKALFALEIGALSDVVEASDGFHIYKLNERKAEVTPTLEEKKEEIREDLIADQISTLSSTWIQEQQASAKIETLL